MGIYSVIAPGSAQVDIDHPCREHEIAGCAMKEVLDPAFLVQGAELRDAHGVVAVGIGIPIQPAKVTNRFANVTPVRLDQLEQICNLWIHSLSPGKATERPVQ